MRHLSSVNRQAGDKSTIRSALIEAAARLIATEGARALSLRRVADEVGTSTMSVYTHFGGMPELRRAVRQEGYARLAAQVAALTESADPVADLAMLGRVYYDNAIDNPHLYRVMFMEQPLDEADAATGWETRGALVNAMQRCIDARRFAPADAEDLAREFWALGHGVVTLQLAQLLTPEQALRCLSGAVRKLFVGYGDDPDAVRTSITGAGRTRVPKTDASAA